ncbi:peptidase family M1-domain-containing protein [Trametes polyzona]|nr:peptidase family M1-domain-containing protein [Trametes polyzona]
MSNTTKDYRLPTDVTPKHYDLTVWTDLVQSKFEGTVQAILNIAKQTSKIALNTLDLDLTDVVIYPDATNVQGGLRAMDTHLDRVSQRGTFTFPSPLTAGTEARLSIAFSGKLTSNLSGYYRSAGGADGKTVYSLTQFQPTSARKAFPCWDEPALKATFSITMASRVGSGVNLSNMPAISEQIYSPDAMEANSWLSKKLGAVDNPRDWKITRFETTPPISTYLVAYANGPFEYLEAAYNSPLSGMTRPLRIYATADLIAQGQYALDIMQKIMPVYEELFDLEYPLPKLDILVSSDLDLGGMENWGLITGRTAGFLLDPNTNNPHVKHSVASMVSHEVAHMWFGDITTMKWWDNLYLNEGFATLVGEKIILDRLYFVPETDLILEKAHRCDRIFPEWQLDATFLGDNLYPALTLDAKLSSHPIEVECPDANKIIQANFRQPLVLQSGFGQVLNLFSITLYGSLMRSVVLRMLVAYIGEGQFLRGVSIYLKKHKYKNTVTKDL